MYFQFLLATNKLVYLFVLLARPEFVDSPDEERSGAFPSLITGVMQPIYHGTHCLTEYDLSVHS